MSENENIAIDEQTAPESVSKLSRGAKIAGGIKEWFRKFTVKLKRRPMNIAFFMLIVSSLVYLFLLGSISQAALEYAKTGVPISMFINTLFCILVLLLFMYAFPKRSKKPKIVMLILTFVFMAVLFALDILLFVRWTAAWDEACKLFATTETGAADKAIREKYIYNAINGVLAHAILVAIAALLTATYPLYGKLIAKINTRKNVESTEIKEAIDTSAEV